MCIITDMCSTSICSYTCTLPSLNCMHMLGGATASTSKALAPSQSNFKGHPPLKPRSHTYTGEDSVMSVHTSSRVGVGPPWCGTGRCYLFSITDIHTLIVRLVVDYVSLQKGSKGRHQCGTTLSTCLRPHQAVL